MTCLSQKWREKEWSCFSKLLTRPFTTTSPTVATVQAQRRAEIKAKSDIYLYFIAAAVWRRVKPGTSSEKAPFFYLLNKLLGLCLDENNSSVGRAVIFPSLYWPPEMSFSLSTRRQTQRSWEHAEVTVDKASLWRTSCLLSLFFSCFLLHHHHHQRGTVTENWRSETRYPESMFHKHRFWPEVGVQIKNVLYLLDINANPLLYFSYF